MTEVFSELARRLDELKAESQLSVLPDDVVQLLREVWLEVEGGAETGMNVAKLAEGRIERLTWDPPLVSFRIERHGATARGSTRAEVHEWTVHLEQRTATVETVGMRQVRPTQSRLDVHPICEQVVSLIRNRSDDDCLLWAKTRERVTIRIGKLIPDGGPKGTVAGRRKRLARALEQTLAKFGWERISGTRPHTYQVRE